MLKKFIFLLMTALLVPSMASARTRLDRSLKPDSSDALPDFYREKGVIQNRFVNKKNSLILGAAFFREFSDHPIQLNGLEIELGYAFSESFEFYLTGTPVFLTQDRTIIEETSILVDANGDSVKIDALQPQYQYGALIHWAPGYGKDSIGSVRTVRSDTFFKLGAKMTTFEGQSGMSYILGVGKTFFAWSSVGIRVSASYNYMENYVNDEKIGNNMLLFEIGSYLYL